jgi:hypothetical protein
MLLWLYLLQIPVPVLHGTGTYCMGRIRKLLGFRSQASVIRILTWLCGNDAAPR